jgi:hypothetical protein
VARKYTITSGLISLAASTTKVACALATPSTETAVIIAASISFDSTATGAGAIPVRVAIVRTTAASSGGSTFTPSKWRTGQIASVCTARINDTSDGTSPTVIDEYLIPPTLPFPYQLPLSREYVLDASDFLELRVQSQAGLTTCNYIGNFSFEEGGSG